MKTEIVEAFGWIGLLVLIIVFALVMAIYGTPHHAPGCKDPNCRYCSGGPR